MPSEAAPQNLAMRVGRDCPVCGHCFALEIHRQRFELGADSLLPSEYGIVSCDNCASVYADTAAEQTTYDHYYEVNSSYEDASVSTGSGADEFDRLRLEHTASIVTALAEKFRVSGNVVDIGCARGGLLQILRTRGFSNLSGIDPSQACVEEINRYGLTGIKAKLSEIGGQPQDQAYTLIILSHVLEHVRDLRTSMLRVAGMLRKDGVVYIEAPNAARYGRPRFPPFYFFDSEHINHFDIDSLRNLAGVSGLAVVDHGEHEIDVGGGRRYPAVWVGLARSSAALSITPALHLRRAVAEYVAQSLAASRYVGLERLAESGRPVVIWGAGSHTQRLLANSPLARCNIIGIVDRNRVKQGHILRGIPVSAPETTLQGLAPHTAVVIASVLHGSEIIGEIRARGLSNDVIVED